jgi:hypothetical protein
VHKRLPSSANITQLEVKKSELEMRIITTLLQASVLHPLPDSEWLILLAYMNSTFKKVKASG